MQQETLTLFDEDKNEGYLVAEVLNIFFEAPASLYKVALVGITETDLDLDSEVTITGNFPELVEGTSYYFKGKITEHPKYGRQVQVLSYKPEILSSKDGVIAYLAGDHFEGIGKKTAEKIVAQLGENAVDKLLNDPTVADELGLSAKQKENLLAGITADNGAEHTLIGLSTLGFSEKMAGKLFEKYREKTLDVVHENPYQLVYDIEGFGFNRADQLALKLGVAATAEVRLAAAIFESMAQLSLYLGNTYTDGPTLLKEALRLLEQSRPEKIEPELLADQLLKMGEKGQVISDDSRIYLRRYYEAEYTIAEELKRLATKTSEQEVSDTQIDDFIQAIQKDLQITYGPDQKAAIKAAVKAPVFLLTGGPGTGKTTIIMGIVRTFAALHELDLSDTSQTPILLAAPTGRAAKKMSEATGLPASTIHRLLGLNGREDELPEETKVLEGQLLIVDETSMVDTVLLQLLLESIPEQMQVIFVGDRNQLPSVGPGQVFSDLLASETLPQKELAKIYRQGDGSTIIKLAHAVKDGIVPPDLMQKTNDRSFIPCHADQVSSVVEQVVTAALAKQNKSDDVQILAPMYRGAAGITNLNQTLQALLNPKKTQQKEIKFGNNVFRIGDSVLHLVNDPENNIFNGDIGKIVGIELKKDRPKEDKVIISFDGQEVEFGRKDLINLTLAYCISIHKSQGSEFPIVILPMVQQYSRMFARNLLYTALTRAKEKLILLGEPEAYAKCIQTVALNRKTTLTTRLWEVLGKPKSSDTKEATKAGSAPKFILTPALVKTGEIDPMIGMDNLTPADFMR